VWVVDLAVVNPAKDLYMAWVVWVTAMAAIENGYAKNNSSEEVTT
jgi:hypothetical protein